MTIVHIVDDDASVRTAISRLLQAAGYDVAVYESAEELLARLPEQSEPGCILLDVVMPGLSGPEVQDYLRKLGSIADCLHDRKRGADRLARPADQARPDAPTARRD